MFAAAQENKPAGGLLAICRLFMLSICFGCLPWRL
jgi:hypothetical protein